MRVLIMVLPVLVLAQLPDQPLASWVKSSPGRHELPLAGRRGDDGRAGDSADLGIESRFFAFSTRSSTGCPAEERADGLTLVQMHGPVQSIRNRSLRIDAQNA